MLFFIVFFYLSFIFLAQVKAFLKQDETPQTATENPQRNNPALLILLPKEQAAKPPMLATNGKKTELIK
ncbi:MAG: hypothetical protein LBV62_01950 [Rickettsiales bacterium]|nr:hypothetical protein [Rickettsiales bacterium]